MTKKQLLALCVCNVVLFIGISSLVGLMPVYLAELGADSGFTGFFLAFAFLALALSNVAGGWLSDRFQQRKIFLIGGGVLAAPIAVLMSQVTAPVLLTIVMICLWFVTGITITMLNILIGLFSEAGNRGRIFGILNLSLGTGIFLGSLFSGPVVDRWGFPALFMLLGGLYLIIPAVGMFIQDKATARSQTDTASPGVRSIFTNRTFLFLFIGSIVGQGANSLMILSRPLIMDGLNFDATAITGALAVGSLITLPLPLVAGRLSDRFGRKPVLIVCVLTTTAALMLQVVAVDLWHFWVVSALQTIMGVSLVAGSALVTDIFPEKSLGTALSLFNATPPLGILVGLSSGGVAIRSLDMIPTVTFAVIFTLVAAALFTLLPAEKSKRQPEPAFG